MDRRGGAEQAEGGAVACAVGNSLSSTERSPTLDAHLDNVKVDC